MKQTSKIQIMKNQAINWKSIALYFLLAVVLIAPFRINSIEPTWLHAQNLPPFLMKMKAWLTGFSPALAAIITIYLFKQSHQKTVSFLGNRKSINLLMMLVPWMVLSIIGFSNDLGMNRHLYGFVNGGIIWVYALLEEKGWRGFLLDALAPSTKIKKALIIGTLWYLWHLTLLNRSSFTMDVIQQELMFWGIMLVASYFINDLTMKTKSYGAAAGLHMLFNVVTALKGASSNEKIAFLVIALGIIISIDHFLNSKSSDEIAE